MDLYMHPVSPPCHAVQMVAKHLNIDLNLKNVDLINGEHLSEKYLEVSQARNCSRMQ